jgi:hypothetical protein
MYSVFYTNGFTRGKKSPSAPIRFEDTAMMVKLGGEPIRRMGS